MKHRNALSIDMLINILYGEIAREGSQKAAARKLGISPQYLNDIINYRREPGHKLLAALGLERLVLYVNPSGDDIPKKMYDVAVHPDKSVAPIGPFEYIK